MTERLYTLVLASGFVAAGGILIVSQLLQLPLPLLSRAYADICARTTSCPEATVLIVPLGVILLLEGTAIALLKQPLASRPD